MGYPVPAHEERRLAALRRYDVLDTEPETAFDGIAKLAARVIGTPIALVTLVDEERQWFKARVGYDATETSRDVAFCAHAIAYAGPVMEVRDASADPRFANNPFVTGDPLIRFYAGAPLLTDEGDAIGTLCVIDRSPRVLTDEQRADLRVLADMVMAQLELRRLAMELRVEEERLESLLQHSSDVVTVLDQDARVTYASPATHELIGVAPEARVGRDVLDILHPEDEPRIRDWFFELLSTPGATSRADARLRHADGTWRHVEAVAVNSLGDPVISGVVLTIRDVGARKEAEEAVKAARDEAMRSSALKSNFLATMSHEIRTPMNAVIGMTGLLLDTDLDPTQRVYARSVRTAGESLLALLNDILDLSKIEAGRVDLELVDFQVATVVEDIADLFAEVVRAKSVELMVFVDPALPEVVRGDPNRLRQVLTNLMGNAAKFTERGEIVVSATTAVCPDGRPGVRFEVRDTGIGMSADQRDRLFEPFSQADATTTRRYGGTGLGLAISNELVALMGGAFEVITEKDVGTSFAFTIPLEPIAPRTTPEGLRGLRVLIVDAHPTGRLLLERLLRAAVGDVGDVGVASSADEAAARLRTERFHAVVSTVPVARGDVPVVQLAKPVRYGELLFALARALDVPVDARDHDDPSTASAAGPASGRVLVVEDHAVNQLVMTRVLDKLGYRADVAGNGLEAVDAVVAGDYDAVFMDVQMPELDGYGATRRIRAFEQQDGRRRIPIIAMTASAIAGERDRCLAAGMDDYLSKPVRPEDVAVALQRWIDDLVDQAQFDTLRQVYDEPPALQNAIEIFAAELRSTVTKLEDAIAASDPVVARRMAHSLAGSAGTLGAAALAGRARAAEAALGRGDIAAAGTSCRGMGDLAERSIAKLTALAQH